MQNRNDNLRPIKKMMFQNKTSDCSGQKLGRQFDASAKNSNKTKN